MQSPELVVRGQKENQHLCPPVYGETDIQLDNTNKGQISINNVYLVNKYYVDTEEGEIKLY